MWIIKNNTSLGMILLTVGLFYIHWSIGEAIVESLLWIWYAALFLIGIGIIFSSALAIRVLMTKWQEQADKAKMSIIERQRADRDIRTFARDEQIYQFGIDPNERGRRLDLIVTPEFNGALQKPSEQQIAIFNMVNTTNTQNNYYDNEDKPVYDGVPLLESGMNDSAWIDDIVMNAPHIHLAGPTRTGKTTLAQLLIDKLMKVEKGSDFWLIAPKYMASRPVWPMAPFVKDIDMVTSGLMKLVDMLDIRKNDPDYNPDNDPNQIIIIDDWEFIYKKHKNVAVDALVMLLKIGAELNFRVLLIGQSTLSGDTGLSRSDYNNMVSIVLKHEAYQMLKMLPMTNLEKRPYREELAMMERNNQRYALVVPYSGQPIVRGIPDLSHYLVPQDKPVLQAPLTMDLTEDQRELTVIEMLKEGKSLRKTAEFLTGKDDKDIGSPDTNKVKSIAQKHGLKLEITQRKRTVLSSLES